MVDLFALGMIYFSTPSLNMIFLFIYLFIYLFIFIGVCAHTICFVTPVLYMIFVHWVEKVGFPGKSKESV